MTSRRTTIFTKRPRPGEVKTRLVPPLSAEEAALLAEAMLADTVEKCLGCADFETTLCIAPAGEEAWFRARFPGVREIRGQHGDGLGARMAHDVAEQSVLFFGSTLCLVGSDAPHVPVERIRAAHRALEAGADLAIGPDEGGGYYLVALKCSYPELFLQVPMSTRDMCTRTVELARSLGLAVELLEREYDIDSPEDLRRLARDLARGPRPRAPRTAALLATLGPIER